MSKSSIKKFALLGSGLGLVGFLGVAILWMNTGRVAESDESSFFRLVQDLEPILEGEMEKVLQGLGNPLHLSFEL